MRRLQRINARLQLDIVVWQLCLLACIARLLLDPLLAAGGKGSDRGGDGLAEVLESGGDFVHGAAEVAQAAAARWRGGCGRGGGDGGAVDHSGFGEGGVGFRFGLVRQRVRHSLVLKVGGELVGDMIRGGS